MTGRQGGAVVEAAPPTLAEVVASSRAVSWGTRGGLWPSRRPPIARQVCVDWVDDQGRDGIWVLPCEDCPETAACLVAKRLEVGLLMYDQEFLTTPRSASSSIFPRERTAKMLRPDLSLVTSFTPGQRGRFAVVNGWDLAWSERTGGDYLVKITAAFDRKTRKRRMLDISRWQGMTFRNQVDLIRQQHLLYSANLTVLEEAGAQSVWTQEVRQARSEVHDEASSELLAELNDLRVIGHSASDKRSLQKGVPSLLLDIERDVWEIPYQEGTYHFEEVENFLSELEAFGWNDDKLEGVGEHDDTVMSWWHTSWGLDELVRSRASMSVPGGQI